MTVAIPEAPTVAEDLVPGALTGTIVPVARQISLPTEEEWRVLAHMSNALAESGMLGRHLNGRAKAVMAVILKGRELGLPQMEALSSIYIIEGVPTLSAHLMLALVRRSGHKVWFSETSSERATICGQRRDWDGSLGEVESVTWTIDDARRAALVNKDNWKHYPAAMLRARATTALCRMTFSDVLMGAVYTPEELGASVNSRGEVTRLPSKKEALDAAGGMDERGDESGDERQPHSTVPVPADTDAALTPDTVDAEAEPTVYDRDLLWTELLTQARIAGQSYRSFTSRWAAAHKKNIEQATNAELGAFVESRRSYVEELLEQDPTRADNTPVGKVPADTPPDPEAPADDAEPEQPADTVTPADEPAPEGTEPDDADPPAGTEPVDEPEPSSDLDEPGDTPDGSLPLS